MKKKIGELVDIRRGASPRPIQEYLVPEGMPWIKIADATEDKTRFISKTKQFIKFEGISKSVIVEPGTMILSNSATPGLPKIVQIPACIHDGWLTFSNYRGITRDFLYYVFLYIKDKLVNRANGSVFNNLKTDIVRDYEIDVPPVSTQNKIVQFLSVLDKAIENNLAINDNLAQQVSAIYTYMFITNADPSWKTGKLSDIVTVRYGKDHKKLSDGIYPVYGSGGIMRYVERPLYSKESVLIPRKGTLNNVIYVNQPFWSVDTMFYTEMRMPNVAKFIYNYIKAIDLSALNAGSAVPSMTTDILNAIELTIPSESALEKFEEMVSPMYMEMQTNNIQSEKLGKLRDVLLPKLLSGELDIHSSSLGN